MLQFYLRLCRTAVAELFRAGERVVTGSAVVLFFMTWFNRDIAKKLANDWEGLSRWWSIAPVAILMTYRLARANYAAFKTEHSLRLQAEAQGQPKDPASNARREAFQKQLNKLNEAERRVLRFVVLHGRLNRYQVGDLLQQEGVIGGGSQMDHAQEAERLLNAVASKASFIQGRDEGERYWHINEVMKPFLDEWAATQEKA